MKMAGQFSRRIRGLRKPPESGGPLQVGRQETPDAEGHLRHHPTVRGLFLILVSRAMAIVWEVSDPIAVWFKI